MFSSNRKAAFKSPLARRLTILIVLVSSAITLVLTLFQLYLMYSSGINAMQSELQQIKKVHLPILSQALWAANSKDLGVHLNGIIQMPSIVFASVQDSQQTWAMAGQPESKNVVEQTFPLTFLYHDNVQTIGTLRVVATRAAIYQQLFDQTLIILASNAFKTFLVAAFMLMFFHRQVNRFLGRTTQYLANLDPATHTEPLNLNRSSSHRHDEFDVLAEVINTMREKTFQAHTEVAKNKEQFHAIADYTVDWESWIGVDGKLIWVNPSVTRMTGYTPEECYAMPEYPVTMLTPDSQVMLREELRKAVRGSTAENVEFRLQRKEGTQTWMSISWQPILDYNKQFKGFRTSVRDISYMKKMETNLHNKIDELTIAEEMQQKLLQLSQQEKARMMSLLAAMNIGILFEDVSNKVIYVNPTFRRIWLIAESVDLSQQRTNDVLAYSSNVLSRPDHFSRHILHITNTHEVSETFEIVMADGRVVTQLSYPVHDQEGRYIGRLWVYEDVTRERQTAEQLIYLAERDSLTGLYNRHRFQEELSRTLAAVERNKSKGALLFFDLDEFKYVNDNFGHRAGDAMLIRVAGELSALVRKNEIVSRIGGDEFAILSPNASKEDAVQLAERIIRSTSQVPFRIEGQNLRLTTSLGIALYPEHGMNSEELIAHADTAMYQAKEAGKNAWRIYSEDNDSSKDMLQRLTWRDRIANALENDLFVLHYQGIYRAEDKLMCHVEALVRMRDATDSSRLIMPGHFIPVAEKTGLTLAIDRWVIKQSVEKLALLPNLPAIAVNISGRSFDDPELPHYIRETLKAYKIEPKRLMVELTETAAVSDLHDAQRFIESLHQTGCQVCLDDFGSGFSSFAYLKHLRADILKIDGLFIRDLPNDRDNQIFVKSIVDVARGMHKQTIAEFVENKETLDMLQKFGVDLVQGYYLDMPQEHHPVFDGTVAIKER